MRRWRRGPGLPSGDVLGLPAFLTPCQSWFSGRWRLLGQRPVVCQVDKHARSRSRYRPLTRFWGRSPQAGLAFGRPRWLVAGSFGQVSQVGKMASFPPAVFGRGYRAWWLARLLAQIQTAVETTGCRTLSRIARDSKTPCRGVFLWCFNSIPWSIRWRCR